MTSSGNILSDWNMGPGQCGLKPDSTDIYWWLKQSKYSQLSEICDDIDWTSP